MSEISSQIIQLQGDVEREINKHEKYQKLILIIVE